MWIEGDQGEESWIDYTDQLKGRDLKLDSSVSAFLSSSLAMWPHGLDCTVDSTDYLTNIAGMLVLNSLRIRHTYVSPIVLNTK